MPHPLEHRSPSHPLDDGEAEAIAGAMRAFGAASRVRLLWALVDGERTVEELEALTGMTQSLVSHQLRILRDARLVRVRRDGRRAHYRLHDHHVPELLAAVRFHLEHTDPPAATAMPRPAAAASRPA